MICDGDSKVYCTIWCTWMLGNFRKWENTDKQSPDYKKWFKKEYANWEEAVHKRMETYVRELRKKEKKLKDGITISY